MRRLAGVVAVACSICAVGCVDGTTPDCKTPTSGCYAGDAGNGDGGQSDASDASSDGGSEGGSDATAD